MIREPPVTVADPPPPRARPRTPSADLAPVLEALAGSARARAQTLLSEARRYELEALERARDEAEQILRQARLDGEDSASRAAAMLAASGRRQAHEEVLAARRKVLDELRSRAVQAIEQRAATADGRRLADALRATVNRRVGRPAPPTVAVAPQTFGVITAELGNRRASASVEDLVASVLDLVPEEVESLWA